jgi:hypothetical protein
VGITVWDTSAAKTWTETSLVTYFWGDLNVIGKNMYCPNNGAKAEDFATASSLKLLSDVAVIPPAIGGGLILLKN